MWGFGKKERSPQPGFGLYVLRKDGHGIEAMTEKLIEAGYLVPDVDGQVDPAVFEDKFHEELAGNSQYSIHHDIAAQQEQRAGEQHGNVGANAGGKRRALRLRAVVREVDEERRGSQRIHDRQNCRHREQQAFAESEKHGRREHGH